MLEKTFWIIMSLNVYHNIFSNNQSAWQIDNRKPKYLLHYYHWKQFSLILWQTIKLNRLRINTSEIWSLRSIKVSIHVTEHKWSQFMCRLWKYDSFCCNYYGLRGLVERGQNLPPNWAERAVCGRWHLWGRCSYSKMNHISINYI